MPYSTKIEFTKVLRLKLTQKNKNISTILIFINIVNNFGIKKSNNKFLLPCSKNESSSGVRARAGENDSRKTHDTSIL